MAASAPDRSPLFPLRPCRAAFPAAGLLAVHFALAIGSKRHERATADELIHLTAATAPEETTFPRLEGNPSWWVSDFPAIVHEFSHETGGPISRAGGRLGRRRTRVRFMSTSVMLRSLLSADA